MPFLRFLIIGISIQFIGLIESWADEVFFIRDIWTDQPVSEAQITSSQFLIVSDEHGSFRINITALDSAGILIFKDGYFEITLQKSDLKTPIIYLIPVENTVDILCVQPKMTDVPMKLPSHISRIFFDQSQINSENNVADVLATQSGVFMKSYGPAGQMQSISIRGMSPEQTQVLFDGIPMNSLQLGSVDLGYYPLQNIGSLEIYRGGNAHFGGSGSIGGSIDLHPAPLLYNIGYNVSSTFNSLDAFMFNGAIDLPVKTYRQRIFLNHAHALNNYTADYEGRSVSLENRDYKQLAYGYQNAFQMSQNLSLNGFFSGYQRESGSPEAFINPEKEKENVARRQVENYLGKIRFSYNIQGFGINFQGYHRDEWMEYKDSSLLINFAPQHSVHKNKETGLQLRMHYLLLNKAIINSGVETARQAINSTDAGEHIRRRLACYLFSDYEIFSDYLFFVRSLNINGSLRYESFSNYDPILLPGFGINVRGSFWQIYLTGSRNYRIPTFNELYWQPGGNEELDPEKSLNLETGIEFENHANRYLFYNFRVALFQNAVKDQIKWLPDDNIIWSPRNISEVLSKGLECEVSISDPADIHRFSFNYRYGISEKYKAEFDGDETVGNQLPFLPREQYNLMTRTGWNFLRFGINYSHVSFRYKTIENESDQILPSCSIAGTWTGFEFDLWKNKIRISLAVENLFNQDYQVMDGYPMPGRNYTLTLSGEY
jgi:vitamin B12 transporter